MGGRVEGEGSQLLWGIHSFGLPGIEIFWVSSRIFFNFCLTIDIGMDRSENLLEPGIIMLFSLGVHFSKIFLMIPFQR